MPRIPYSPSHRIGFTSDVESIVVESLQHRSCSHNDQFFLKHYTQLREIVIHDYNYCQCLYFSLRSLPQLRTLVLEDNSFYRENLDVSGGTFSIRDCPSLTSVTIGDSFCEYTRFDISGAVLAAL